LAAHLYAVALGSNRAGKLGAPVIVIEKAIDALTTIGCVTTRSTTHATPAIGSARRRFANAAALIETDLAPPALLAALKAIERDFGRRPGQRWGDRTLDLDILLWSGGRVRTRTLAIPHIHLAHRRFVLDPLAEIAPNWRLPGKARAIRHLRARLTRRGPSA
jgi:2-amino-4-hydroxy-6-hydroxymethyldihydropteridine diphosphokinase